MVGKGLNGFRFNFLLCDRSDVIDSVTAQCTMGRAWSHLPKRLIDGQAPPPPPPPTLRPGPLMLDEKSPPKGSNGKLGSLDELTEAVERRWSGAQARGAVDLVGRRSWLAG